MFNNSEIHTTSGKISHQEDFDKQEMTIIPPNIKEVFKDEDIKVFMEQLVTKEPVALEVGQLPKEHGYHFDNASKERYSHHIDLEQ